MLLKQLHVILFIFIFIFIVSVIIGNYANATGLTEDGASENLLYHQDVLLRDMLGNSVTLQHYIGKGQWLVVMIWASKCKICDTEISDYIQFHEQHKNNNASVLGISVDGWLYKENARIFINKHHVTFPNVVAAPMLVAHLFRMQTGKELIGTPSFLLYSPEGELKVVHSGVVASSVLSDFIKHAPCATEFKSKSEC